MRKWYRIGTRSNISCGKVGVGDKRRFAGGTGFVVHTYANKDGCVGMAANMIGVRKRIIVFDNEGTYMTMFNPEIMKKSWSYDTE